MAANIQKTEDNLGREVFGEVQQDWDWLLGIGIVFVILGFIGLGMNFVVTMASALMYGVRLLIGAGAQLVYSAECQGWTASSGTRS